MFGKEEEMDEDKKAAKVQVLKELVKKMYGLMGKDDEAVKPEDMAAHEAAESPLMEKAEEAAPELMDAMNDKEEPKEAMAEEAPEDSPASLKEYLGGKKKLANPPKKTTLTMISLGVGKGKPKEDMPMMKKKK